MTFVENWLDELWAAADRADWDWNEIASEEEQERRYEEETGPA